MSRGSMLPAGLVLAGEIRGQGDLVVGGTVEGPVQIDGHLVIEAGATIRGEAKARSIVIRGTLLGPAIADETIKLESGARMVGDARAERVSVIEGALLRGRITMTGPQASRRSSAGAVVAAAPPAAAAAVPPRGGASMREHASPMARSSSGVLVAPRGEDELFGEENRTNRFVRPTDLQVPRSSAPPPGGTIPPAQALPPARPVPPRASEPRTAEPRVVEPRVVEPRAVEPRAVAVEPRTVEPRTGEPRTVEPRTVEPRTGEAPLDRGRTRDRRPPEPVIPGVGRQRARRKDGGATT